MTRDEIVKMILGYISEHVFSGKIPSDFTMDTSMVNSRLVNSIIVLHMINYIEEKINVEFEAHEISVDNIDTVNLLADFVVKKSNAKE